MILLMRHGEDDDSRLGGWSDAGLSLKGKEQVENTCENIRISNYNIQHIFSSDLQGRKKKGRGEQTEPMLFIKK